ncbi:MAG: hypothetical protein JNN04_00800 [Cyclobacteriaceae bacterium]|nr:hypothetical protein [Cyclobacteriaceae bacterium]
MKTNKIASIVLLTTLLTGACVQKPIEPTPPVGPPIENPNPGSASFTKFVAVGDSYVAGMQAGALFDAGQANSIPKIMATQFATVGGGAFNQPDINHPNGFNATFSSVPTAIRGRLVLFDPDGSVDPDGSGCQVSRSAAPRAANTPASTSTCPSTVNTPAMPAPYNSAQSPLDPGFVFAGNKATLNNFGVPGAKLIHAGVPNYGTLNPLYGRFASNPAAKPIITDAAEKAGSFFLFSFGAFDILNYATTGASASNNGVGNNDMTPSATFAGAYGATLGALLLDPNAKGVVTTVPDITTLPYFTTVAWNAVEFKSTNCTDAATLALLNGMTGFGGYNAALDGLVAAMVITAEEAAKRKVVYAYGKNGILIKDETLADLGAVLGGINPALAPYGQIRQAKSTDLITLAAGGILGTCGIPPGGTTPSPLWVFGVSAPLDDNFVLLPTEITDIQARTVDFNNTIKAAATAASGRVAVADLYQAYMDLLTNKVYVANGVTITPSFAPPAGMFSEDGIHPNSRGAAFTANVVIEAINTAFSAKIPKASLALYPGTGLPVNGQ